MNGRLYDPAIGRFLSADPTIQYPDDMQNYNRYSYINNNPLSATDPSGHGFFGSFFSGISRLVSGAIRSVGRLLNNSFIRTIASIAVAYYLGPGPGALFGNAVANGAVAGFASGLIAGRGDLRAAISGAVTGGIFGFIGDIGIGSNIYEKTALHAFGGCFSAAFGGGDCKSGALSAGFAEGLGTSGALGDWGKYGNIARNAVIGGTASLASGGKFANGAVTAAFGYLFNCMQHSAGCASDNGLKKARELWREQLALDEKGIQPVYPLEEAVFSFMGGKVGAEILTNAPRVVNYIDKYSDIIYYGFEAAAAILGSASPIATDTMLPRQEYVNLSNSYDINKQQEFNKNSQRPFKIPIRIKKFP